MRQEKRRYRDREQYSGRGGWAAVGNVNEEVDCVRRRKQGGGKKQGER